jgi:hypothetical protein
VPSGGVLKGRENSLAFAHEGGTPLLERREERGERGKGEKGKEKRKNGERMPTAVWSAHSSSRRRKK